MAGICRLSKERKNVTYRVLREEIIKTCPKVKSLKTSKLVNPKSYNESQKRQNPICYLHCFFFLKKQKMLKVYIAKFKMYRFISFL